MTLISELPDEIRILAEKRRKEYYFPAHGSDNDNLLWAFDWDNTPEGDEYWRRLSGEDLDEDDEEYVNGRDDQLIYE